MTSLKSLKTQKTDFTFTIFEIIPLERLTTTKYKDVLEKLTDALINYDLYSTGCEDYRGTAKIFYIENIKNIQKIFEKTINSIKDEDLKNHDEFIWTLALDYCKFLIIDSKFDNILFALASNKKPDSLAPFSPNTIAQYMGTFTYPPSLARILCVDALKKNGLPELSNNFNVISSFPSETALVGDITYTAVPKHPLGGFNLNYLGTDIEIQYLSLLNSKSLITQNIVKILNNESIIRDIEIAKVYPLQFTSADKLIREKSFSLINYMMINAKYGTLFEILEEMLSISIHLNWEFSKDLKKNLTKKEAKYFADLQNNRLKKIEQKEKSLRNGLNMLQKRFPQNSQLIEWEINNLYSNIINYSPIYIQFRSHLRSYLQYNEELFKEYKNIISELDWIRLSENSIANSSDGKRIINLLEIDAGFVLMKMRIILEKIIKKTYRIKISKEGANLRDMIYKLNQKNLIPPVLHVFINSLRISGNIGAHELSDKIGTKKDIEAILPIFIRIVEWFLDNVLND